MKIFAIAFLVAAMLLSGCEKDEKAQVKEDMPKNILSYEEKSAEELIPNGETTEHGDVVEADGIEADLPSEDELGEYKEVLMGGDNIDDNTCAGRVLAISLKDITVNTYNELTTYTIERGAENTAKRLKPGDAVIVRFTVNEDGTKSVYDLGRVRTEDKPLSRDEILQMYADSEDSGE